MQQRQDTVTSRALVPQQGNVFWNGDEEPHCFYGQNVLYFSEPHLGVMPYSQLSWWSDVRNRFSAPVQRDMELVIPVAITGKDPRQQQHRPKPWILLLKTSPRNLWTAQWTASPKALRTAGAEGLSAISLRNIESLLHPPACFEG
uniref:Uncharacterized protein n=1 Tax=Coccidioides posadasii RMSCC 3488 TaxID=454284 RepID=A0A0J6F4I4_COCPO|nr:hypothetical protein CPAG_01415 [Coccidioides posadasii RMSCC 3488]